MCCSRSLFERTEGRKGGPTRRMCISVGTLCTETRVGWKFYLFGVMALHDAHILMKLALKKQANGLVG